MWHNLGRNSIFFFPSPSLVFVERTIYNSIKSQITTFESDFNSQTPYLEDRTNAFLIIDSPHGETFDLQKLLVSTSDFMVECSWCEWEVSSLLPLIVFSVYKDFLKVYDVTFNPSYKYTKMRSQDTLISCSWHYTFLKIWVRHKHINEKFILILNPFSSEFVLPYWQTCNIYYQLTQQNQKAMFM